MKKQVELKQFLHRRADGKETLLSYDYTKGGKDAFWLNEMGVCMGEVTVRGEYDDIEGDPRDTLIDGLENAIEQERADSHMRIKHYREQIEQLRCLPHIAAGDEQ